MTRQLERLLLLDELLRSRPRPTAEMLGEVLECPERTIRSDLAFLRDRYGAPIEFSPQRGWHILIRIGGCRVCR
jgi:predicted DNA-binding transcriptional regulator YafY